MTGEWSIPFLDLATPHRELEEELVSLFRTTLRSSEFVGGPVVEAFERQYASYCDTAHCVGVNSGTDALRFALIAAGVNSGDVVVTVPNTFIATAEAISQAGARPEFVDVDVRTYNMDVEKLREWLETRCRFDSGTKRLRHIPTGSVVSAIVPVHMFGQIADMDPILELGERFGLMVVEDACQAQGAEYLSKRERRWRRAGSIGNAGAFSFYPSKNLGACGEAGAVTTNDPDIARRVQLLRDHGQIRKYHHEIEGYNGRLDAIQAGILQLKLKYLEDWNEKRRCCAQRYRELFAEATSITVPYHPVSSRCIYHLYVVRVPDRDGLRAYLAEAGIGSGVHYPVPIHQQKAYEWLGYREGDFPTTEMIAREILSLPMFPHLRPEDQRRISEVVCKFERMTGSQSEEGTARSERHL